MKYRLWFFFFCSVAICWRNIPFSIDLLWYLRWTSTAHMCGFISGSTLLFHWSMCLSFMVLTIIALQLISKSGTVKFPILFFFFKLFWMSQALSSPYQLCVTWNSSFCSASFFFFFSLFSLKYWLAFKFTDLSFFSIQWSILSPSGEFFLLV